MHDDEVFEVRTIDGEEVTILDGSDPGRKAWQRKENRKNAGAILQAARATVYRTVYSKDGQEKPDGSEYYEQVASQFHAWYSRQLDTTVWDSPMIRTEELAAHFAGMTVAEVLIEFADDLANQLFKIRYIEGGR